jgi:hypothetical protein
MKYRVKFHNIVIYNYTKVNNCQIIYETPVKYLVNVFKIGIYISIERQTAVKIVYKNICAIAC